MGNQILQFMAQQANNALANAIRKKMNKSPMPPLETESPEQAFERIYGEEKPVEISPQALKEKIKEELTPAIAVACIPCSLGHFSTTVGLLNEIVRFKKDGITSNEVIDRISKCLEEQNALERVDLAPVKMQALKGWEKELAQGALEQSRMVRHTLENVENIEEIEELAANTDRYYKNLNREWFTRRIKDKVKEQVSSVPTTPPV